MSPELIGFIALVTALGVLAVFYLLWRFRRIPDVVVYAVPDLQRPAVINLVIKNRGSGVAQDLRFESDKKIPARAFGFEDAPKPGYMADGPLIDGISSFKPGEKQVITWGQYGGLKKGLGDDYLEITATYSSKPVFGITRDRHRTTSRIDLRIVKGADRAINRTPVNEEEPGEPSLSLGNLE